MIKRRLAIALGLVLAVPVAYYVLRAIAGILIISLVAQVGRKASTIPPNSDYPIEVSFRFSHNGEVYEKSFLTVVHPKPGNWLEVCGIYWTPTRYSFPIHLRDGGVVIAFFKSERCKKLNSESDVVSGTDSWLWFDRPSNPTKIVYGYFGLDASTGASEYSPLEASRLDFTLRRAPPSLITRAEDDDRAGQNAPLTNWHGNFFPSYGPYGGNGLLYVRVKSTPAVIAAPDRFEWINAPDGCRTAFLPQHKEGKLLPSPVRWAEGRSAVKSGAAWDLDNGPLVQSPAVLYPAEAIQTHPSVGTFKAPTTIFKADRQLVAMGQKCTMPVWPASATAAIVDFGHGDLRKIETDLWMESSSPASISQEQH